MAEPIRDAYYYDESAGIVVCLEKAIRAANKKVLHQRDRLGGDERRNERTDRGRPGRGSGQRAVRRDRRAGRGLSDPAGPPVDPARSEPGPGAALQRPRAERLAGRDQRRRLLVIASENLVARIGLDELKDAVLTAPPPVGRWSRSTPASRRPAEAAATRRSRSRRPRSRPPPGSAGSCPSPAPEPLAGTPDRSPIPLADSVTGAASTIQESAGRATAADGGAVGRGFGQLPRSPAPAQAEPAVGDPRLQPGRDPAAGRDRRPRLRRPGPRPGRRHLGHNFVKGSPTDLSSITAAQRSPSRRPRPTLSQVSGPGLDLVKNDRTGPSSSSTDAWQQLDAAEKAGIATVGHGAPPGPGPGRARRALPDDLGRSTVDVSFATANPALDLTRARPRSRRRAVRPRPGDQGGLPGRPQDRPGRGDRQGRRAWSGRQDRRAALFITPGRPDLLILDAKNVLWRWRPSDATGRGTIVKVDRPQLVELGQRRPGDRHVRPERQPGPLQPLHRRPVASATSSSTRRPPTAAVPGLRRPRRLATPQDVSTVDDMLHRRRHLHRRERRRSRFITAPSQGWKADDPGDEILRTAP